MSLPSRRTVLGGLSVRRALAHTARPTSTRSISILSSGSPTARRGFSNAISSGRTLCATQRRPAAIVATIQGDDHGSSDWRGSARFRSGDDRRSNSLPRVAWGLLGCSLFAPEGLHASVHD